MNTIFYLLGCVMYAYDNTPVRTSPVHYSETHYHTHVQRTYVPAPAYPRNIWVAGYYAPNGRWVSGHWTMPYDRPRNPRHSDCHRHADGRTHCGRH